MGRMARKSLSQGVEYCTGCTRPGGLVYLLVLARFFQFARKQLQITWKQLRNAICR